MDDPGPDGTGEQEDCQQWACGPFGWWPPLGRPPVGVSWEYAGEDLTVAAWRCPATTRLPAPTAAYTRSRATRNARAHRTRSRGRSA